ncbi:uncharacterized protein LOC111112391 [Crassostrea virginica]
MCQNTTCQHKNIVPTGKRHGRIWDANAKLAAARTSHITQLAAVHGNETFSTYVMPDIPITASASDNTGLEVRNGILYHHGKKVNTSSISVALDSFLAHLS